MPKTKLEQAIDTAVMQQHYIRTAESKRTVTARLSFSLLLNQSNEHFTLLYVNRRKDIRDFLLA